jgi:hypothetical protein
MELTLLSLCHITLTVEDQTCHVDNPNQPLPDLEEIEARGRFSVPSLSVTVLSPLDTAFCSIERERTSA